MITLLEFPSEKAVFTPPQNHANLSHRILVVHDDSDTCQLSVDVLFGSGYKVDGAKDGAVGWGALQARNNHDLVIIDNKMPEMTGIEKLRAARISVPVIMAKEYLPTHEFACKPWLKPDATLQRPFSNDDLLETVNQVLDVNDGSELT